MSINAGEMRHVVRIERRSSTPDASGEPVLSWVLFAQRRAALDRTPGREVWASSERQGRVPTVFRLRYLADVVPSMRLIHVRDGTEKVFNVVSAIDPDGLRVALVITAEELVQVAP